MTAKQRIIVRDVIPLSVAALLVLLPFLFAGRLPDRIAVHWNYAGQPDGEFAFGYLGLLFGAIVAITWLVTRSIGEQLQRPVLLRATYGMIGLSVSTSLLTLWANDGITMWQDARHFNVILVLIGLLAASGLGLGLGWLFEEEVARPDPPPPTRPSLGLRRGEHAAGLYKVRAPWAMVIPLGPLIVLAVFRLYLWPVVLIGLLLTVGLSQIRLGVSESQVEVAFGPWRWPHKRIAMEHVTGASVEVVDPMQYGGWGYRVVRGARAFVLRSGPALHIETSGQDLIITMSRPEEPAGLINDIVERRSA